MKVLLFAAAILIAAAGALWSGVYNISAQDPHWEATHHLIHILRDRSVIAHSDSVKVPAVNDPKLSARGAPEYHESCRVCHGAPGVPPESLAQGLYPAPSDLLSGHVQKEWRDNQLFWIIDNGFKMTGMPAFGVTLSREDMLGLVAFIRRLPGMTPEQYQAVTAEPREKPRS